ncbi:GNAT family N-acetyltransferase [Brumimicrobium aurantiacum]|uniref:GNAT family N-acetyltransferase n=1 Tax=Brumimicrobium aurantiacum TaxID=1737063 RepID=A0A3E1EZ59_9FLAO|nr:GNAT family N-acetyltransferase [Brumimicrobium aurantiacum]RFC54845.1 GNAT family N-acetyltransferase [Brumimicrobium aurantiacum]
MKTEFRKANQKDSPVIWKILKQAIERRKKDGSNQWQDGYPNKDVISLDIQKEVGYVLLLENEVVGYSAILINDEPEYNNIQGAWITNEGFVVYHRVAIAEEHIGKGLAKELLKHIDEYAIQNNIMSVKADTNFDNPAMLNLFKKNGYKYCGEVFFRGTPRKAFEKILEV